MSYSPDGKMVATAGYDKRVILWDANSGKIVKEIGGFPDAVTAVAFTPCCKYLAAGGMNGAVSVYFLGVDDSDTRNAGGKISASPRGGHCDPVCGQWKSNRRFGTGRKCLCVETRTRSRRSVICQVFFQ